MIQPVWSSAMPARNGFVMVEEILLEGKTLGVFVCVEKYQVSQTCETQRVADNSKADDQISAIFEMESAGP